MDPPGVLASEFSFERNVGQQVNLGQQHQLRLEENRRILKRLVFAFGGAQQNDLCVFSEIVAGRTDQVADIFDNQQVEIFELPVFKVFTDHLGVKVAGAAGGNLLHRKSKPRQAFRIIFGLQIAGKHSNPRALVHALERALQQRGFTRAGSADEVEAQNSNLPVAFPQLFGQDLVLVQNLLFNFYAVHPSTSIYTMSSSSPLMHWVPNSPQSGHRGSNSVMRNS